MANIFQRTATFVTKTSADLRRAARERHLDRSFEQAKADINAVFTAHVHDAQHITANEEYAAAFRVTWHDVLTVSERSEKLHKKRLEELEAKVLAETDAKCLWFKDVDEKTAAELQANRSKTIRQTARTELNIRLKRALDRALLAFEQDADAIISAAHDDAKAQLGARAATLFGKLVDASQKPEPRQEADLRLEKGKETWDARIRAQYAQALSDRLELFNLTERPGLVNGVVRNRTAAHWIKKLLLEDKTVLQAELSGEYQQGDQHLQDQLINTITLTVTQDGTLTYSARDRDAGGRFDFEKNYMTPSARFLSEAANDPPSPQVKTKEDTTIPTTACFFDTVSVPATTSHKLMQFGDIDLTSGDNVNQCFHKFAGDVQGPQLEEDESKFRELPYITNYPGIALIEKWLSDNPARKISVVARGDGLVAIVVNLVDKKVVFDTDNSDVIRCRTAYNEARLMSLLVVAMVSRVLNGAGDERYFPRADSSGTGLVIPSYCVWPLAVRPKGTVKRIDTLLQQYTDGKLSVEDTPPWAVGWTEKLDTQQSLSDALAARLAYIAERHLRVLNSTKEGPIAIRKGINEHDALSKLAKRMMYTCLALCGMWVAAVMSTLFAANAYTPGELWFITLLFSVIGIWRGIMCWRLSAHARVRDARSGRKSRLGNTTGKFVEFYFRRLWQFWIGPAVLGFCILAALVLPPEFKIWPEMPKLDETGHPIFGIGSETASGYQKALYTGVWALPLLAIGLMRQGYMTLHDLVLQRGQLQRKMDSVIGLQETWLAGRERATQNGQASSIQAKAKAITDDIAQMKARVASDIAAARSRFDKGSATNAALIAVLGLLDPFSRMSALKLNAPTPEPFAGLSAELRTLQPDFQQSIKQAFVSVGLTPAGQYCIFPFSRACAQPNPPLVSAKVLAEMTQLNTELREAFETLRDMQENSTIVVTTKTKTAVENLVAAMETLQELELNIDADTRRAHGKLYELSRVMGELQSFSISADVQEAPPATPPAPLFDLNVAWNMTVMPITAPTSIRDALANCDPLGGVRFSTNSANVPEGDWFTQANATDDKLTFTDWKQSVLPQRKIAELSVDQKKRLYILGLADAQGDAVRNLNLSKQRAVAVRGVLAGAGLTLPMVPLPLGEAAWFAGKGLPEHDKDENHRSAAVYLCPEPLPVDGAQRLSSTQ